MGSFRSVRAVNLFIVVLACGWCLVAPFSLLGGPSQQHSIGCRTKFSVPCSFRTGRRPFELCALGGGGKDGAAFGGGPMVKKGKALVPLKYQNGEVEGERVSVAAPPVDGQAFLDDIFSIGSRGGPVLPSAKSLVAGVSAVVSTQIGCTMLTFPAFTGAIDNLTNGGLTTSFASLSVFAFAYAANLASGFATVDCFLLKGDESRDARPSLSSASAASTTAAATTAASSSSSSSSSSSAPPSSFVGLTSRYLPPIFSSSVAAASALTNFSVLIFALYNFPQILNAIAGGVDAPSLTLQLGGSAAAATAIGAMSYGDRDRVSAILKYMVTGFSLAFAGLAVNTVIGSAAAASSAYAVPEAVSSLAASDSRALLFSTITSMLPLAILAGVYQNMVPRVVVELSDEISGQYRGGRPSPSGNSDSQRQSKSGMSDFFDEAEQQRQVAEATRLWSKVVVALGSLIPTFMYVIWCSVSNYHTLLPDFSISSSLASSVGPSAVAAPDALSLVFMNAFKFLIAAASGIGCVLSLAPELEPLLLGKSEDDNDAVSSEGKRAGLSIVGVLLGVAPSLAVVWGMYLFGADKVIALLGASGSVAAPLVYGVMPVCILWQQGRNGQGEVIEGKPSQLE